MSVLTSLLLALGAAAAREHTKEAVLPWLMLANGILVRGANVEAELRRLTVEIEQMVLENRAPTADEWKALQERSDAAHQAIQGDF